MNVCKNLEVREGNQEKFNTKLKKTQIPGCRHRWGVGKDVPGEERWRGIPKELDLV